LRLRAAVSLAIAGALLLLAAPAHAAYPGQNGKIVFSDTLGAFHQRLGVINNDGSPEWDGSFWTRITPDDYDNHQPVWSPDGTRIAVSSPRSGSDSREDIWTMEANGGGAQRVTSIFGQDRWPTWSPDGSKIAFQTNQEGNSEIYMVNADGSDLHNVTNDVEGQDVAPAWSPDGSKIVYISRTTNQFPNPPHYFVMDPDGGNKTQLPTPILGSRPDWSPDSAKLVYSEEHDCGGGHYCDQIHVMDADGSNDQVVYTGERVNPRWSPDGTRIVYQEPGQGVGVMNADGTNGVTLTQRGEGAQTNPDWQPLHITGYERPKSASPIRASLVPVFRQCFNTGGFNRTHGPPLEYVSCSPPRLRSTTLTIGTPDANGFPAESTGSVKLKVVTGTPGTPPDEADLNINASITDVRCSSLQFACPGGAGTDYDGGLLLDVTLRITDKLNGASPDQIATVQETSLRAPFTCVPTAAPEGSACTLATSADAVVPGIVPEGKRSVWQAGQVTIMDEGANGTGYESCPPTCGDGDEAFFMRQGIFVP
jgi:Tol biopolymer transport system component